jgi:hypothetical protein
MAAHLPPDLVLLATSQGRCFSREQALRLGLRARELRVMEQRGVVVRRHAGAFGLAGDNSWQHHLWAGLLQHSGAVASHDSAGRLLAFPGMRTEPTLIVPDGSHPRSTTGVRVHQIGPVPARQLTIVDGLAATNVNRTLCDLAGTIHPARLGFVLDRLLADQRTSLAGVGATLAEVSRRGRPGGPALGRLLDARSGRPVPRSKLEEMLDEALATQALIAPVNEYPLPTDGSLSGFVDRAFPDAKLIVEADGRRWHARYVDFARDRARDRMAARRGWLTIRVSHEELRSDGDTVGRDIADVHQDRIADLCRSTA